MTLVEFMQPASDWIHNNMETFDLLRATATFGAGAFFIVWKRQFVMGIMWRGLCRIAGWFWKQRS